MSLSAVSFRLFYQKPAYCSALALCLAAFSLSAAPVLAAPSPQTEARSRAAKTPRPHHQRGGKTAVKQRIERYSPPPLVKIDFAASPLERLQRGARKPLTAAFAGANWLNAPSAPADTSFMCGQLASSVFARTEVLAEADIAAAILNFYQSRPQFLWLDAEGHTRPQARQIIRVFAESAQDGLSPADYSLPAEPATAAPADSKETAAERRAAAAQFELSLSARLLRYVSDISRGRVPPSAFRKNYDLPVKEIDYGAVLAQLSSSETPQERLAALRPQSDWYAALQIELANLREESGANGAAASREKQAAIEYSLERLRWLPQNFPRSYVLVNIPAFSAQFFADHREILNMKAVVGAPRSPTAILTSQIERVVFNPSWGVPYSIMKNEMAAKIAADPSYLARHNYEIYRGGRRVNPAAVNWAEAARSGAVHIRQKPGRGNALGRLKIIFPNAYNIYMHDTPAQSAFSRENRALSHGCVRLAQPEAMAAAVLGKKESSLAPYFKRPENGVAAPQNIGVYLAYFTAWPRAESGKILYYSDIYKLDAPLAAAEAALSEARAEGNADKPAQSRVSAADDGANANIAALPPEEKRGG